MNFSRLVNKIFMCARVPLFAVQCNSYSDSHYHSLQFGYTFRMGPVSYTHLTLPTILRV